MSFAVKFPFHGEWMFTNEWDGQTLKRKEYPAREDAEMAASFWRHARVVEIQETDT